MAIIRPEGLFHGERLGKCSDLAKLYYPFLRLYANGYGRIEIVPARIIGEVFASFAVKPTEDDIVDVLAEYANNYLLFLYSVGGQFWGQFWCPEHVNPKKKSLPRHKNADDENSPEPPASDYAKWLKEYQEKKSVAKPESVNRLRTLSFAAESPQVRGEVAAEIPRGVGVGVGEGGGGGKTLSKDKPSTTDSRYKPFIEDLQRYWEVKNPNGPKFNMTGKCGKNLKQLLKDRPNVVLDRAIFQRCLNNRARSPATVHSKAVYEWILNVLDYANGPLDRFNKPEGVGYANRDDNRRRANSDAEAESLAALGVTDADLKQLPAGEERPRTGHVAKTVIEIPLAGRSHGD